MTLTFTIHIHENILNPAEDKDNFEVPSSAYVNSNDHISCHDHQKLQQGHHIEGQEDDLDIQNSHTHENILKPAEDKDNLEVPSSAYVNSNYHVS